MVIVVTLMVKKLYTNTNNRTSIPSSSIWILPSLSLGHPSSCPGLWLWLLLGLGEVIVQPLLGSRAGRLLLLGVKIGRFWQDLENKVNTVRLHKAITLKLLQNNYQVLIEFDEAAYFALIIVSV